MPFRNAQGRINQLREILYNYSKSLPGYDDVNDPTPAVKFYLEDQVMNNTVVLTASGGLINRSQVILNRPNSAILNLQLHRNFIFLAN